jgi:hypothetical protein
MSMVAGVDDNNASALLTLLSDPQRLQQSVAQLTEARNQAQAVIDLAGPANEILAIRAKLEVDRQQMTDLLLKAQAQADQTVMQAEATASAVIAEAQKAKQEMADEAIVILAKAKETLAQASAELSAHQQAKEEATSRLVDLGIQHRANEAAQAAMNQKQAELDQRIGQLEKARAALKLLLD